MDLKMEINKLVELLAKEGLTEDNGTNIGLFDENWIKTQANLLECLKGYGFDCSVDAYGNTKASIKGTESPDEIILSGSHIDTVVNGGKLDGHLGIIAAILAMKMLHEKHGAPKRTMQVVSFAEEEGSRFPNSFWGSKTFTGSADFESVRNLLNADGIRFEDAMKNAGLTYDPNGKTDMSKIKTFIEVHIEQGGVLESENKTIGIVECITGIKRYDIILRGQANHAGTTPMNLRKDPMYGFAKIMAGHTDKIKAEGSPAVTTFGKIAASPNTSNVINASVQFTIDMRHTDKAILDRLAIEMESYIKESAKELELDCQIIQSIDEAPTYMNKDLVDLTHEVCVAQNTTFKHMHSGAGHDSQIMADYCPTSMIFVPSRGGISHSPYEHTDLDDLAKGVETLAGMLYELAYNKKPF